MDKQSNIASYIVDGEILNSIFKSLDRTPGEKNYLNKDNVLLSYLDWALSLSFSATAGAYLIHSGMELFKKHKMRNFATTKKESEK